MSKDTFWIIERPRHADGNVPVGLSGKGEPIYVETWRAAAQFRQRRDAERFLRLCKNHGMTLYPDMTGEWLVCEHAFIHDDTWRKARKDVEAAG